MDKEKQRFSLRKAHFGLASAILGSALVLGGGNTTVVQADEQTGPSDADAIQSSDTVAAVETAHVTVEEAISAETIAPVDLDDVKPILASTEANQTEATPVSTEETGQATKAEAPQDDETSIQAASSSIQSTASQVVSTETVNPATSSNTAVNVVPDGVTGQLAKGGTSLTIPVSKPVHNDTGPRTSDVSNRIGKGSSLADIEKATATPANVETSQDLKATVEKAEQAVATSETQVKIADSIVAEAATEVDKAEIAVSDNNKAIVAAKQLETDALKIKESTSPAQVQAWEASVQNKDSEAKELQNRIDKANQDIDKATNALNTLKAENTDNLNAKPLLNKPKIEAELAEAQRMYNINIKNQEEIELALSNLRKDIASKEGEVARLQDYADKNDREKLARIEQLESEISAIQQKQAENLRQREAIEKNALALDLAPNYTSGMTKPEFNLRSDKGISFNRTIKKGDMVKVDYKAALAKAVAGDATELQNLVNLEEKSAFSMSMKKLNMYNMPTDTDARLLNVDNLSQEDLQELNLYIVANINKLRAEVGLMPLSVSKQGIQKADQFKNTIYTATVQAGSPASDTNPPRWGNDGENFHNLNRRVWGDHVDLTVVTGDSGYKPDIYIDTNYAVNELNSKQATMGELKNKLLKSLLNVLTEDIRSMKHSNNFGGAQMLLSDSTNSHIAVAVPRLAGTVKPWSDMNSVVFVTYTPETTEDELTNPFQTGGLANSEFTKQITDLQKEYDDEYKEFIVRDRERLALQDSLVGDTKGIRDLQDAIQFGKRNEAVLAHRLENTQGLLVTYQREIDRIKAELDAEEDELGLAQPKVDDLNEQLRLAQAEKVTAENRLEAIKTERVALVRNIDLAKNPDARIAEARKVVAERTAQVAILANQLEKAKADLASAKVEQVSANSKLTKAKADLQSAKSAYDKASTREEDERITREAEEKAKRDAEQAKKVEESKQVADQFRKEQDDDDKRHQEALEASRKFYAQTGINPLGLHVQSGDDATYRGKSIGRNDQAGSTLPATGSNDGFAIAQIGATMTALGSLAVTKRRRQK